MELIAAFGVALALSLAGNGLALVWIVVLRRELRAAAAILESERLATAKALAEAKKAPAPTLEAQQLLHDLTAGGAIVRLECLNPADLLLRSPKS
jgi:hypothetical protein